MFLAFADRAQWAPVIGDYRLAMLDKLAKNGAAEETTDSDLDQHSTNINEEGAEMELLTARMNRQSAHI